MLVYAGRHFLIYRYDRLEESTFFHCMEGSHRRCGFAWEEIQPPFYVRHVCRCGCHYIPDPLLGRALGCIFKLAHTVLWTYWDIGNWLDERLGDGTLKN